MSLRNWMVRRGWVIPVTPEEVLIAEEAMKDEPPTELPDSLKDPYEIMRRRPDVFGEPPPCKWCHEGLPHPGPKPGYCFKE